MSWAPLTCCSMEAATDCDTTSALAPGKLVVTVTWGGTTCGYCAIGRLTAASVPTRIMTSAMTVEKTGRSMKKLNMTRPWMIYSTCSASRIDGRKTPGSAFLFWCRRRRARTGMAVDECSHDRLHLRAGSKLADPLDHDSIAGVEAAVDDPVVSEAVTGNDLPGLRLVAGADHEYGLQSLELLDRLLRNAERARVFECGDDDAHEQSRAQDAIGIGHGDPHLQRSALLVDRGVDEIEFSGKGVVGAIGKPDVKRRCRIGPVSRRVLQRLLQLQEPVFADAEVHPHPVARVERRQQRLLVSDQRPRL